MPHVACIEPWLLLVSMTLAAQGPVGPVGPAPQLFPVRRIRAVMVLGAKCAPWAPDARSPDARSRIDSTRDWGGYVPQNGSCNLRNVAN